MHLRITPEPGSPTRLRVDGRLTADGVPELMGACETEPRPEQLGLSGLQSADDEGLGALKALAAGGVELLGANPYLALLLGRADRTTDEPAG
jgi:hypothetical protein